MHAPQTVADVQFTQAASQLLHEAGVADVAGVKYWVELQLHVFLTTLKVKLARQLVQLPVVSSAREQFEGTVTHDPL